MNIDILEQFLINEEQSILNSMKKIDQNANKILFLIDSLIILISGSNFSFNPINVAKCIAVGIVSFED